MLQPYLQKFGLRAIAAAVLQRASVVAAGKLGMRSAGTQSPITIDDRFHIVSGSKGFTALLAGQFVEDGRLR